MEPVSLWAAVEFTACNGSTEALLTAAARAGLHPYGVTALPGGFGGRCAAWQYPRLAALARQLADRVLGRRHEALAIGAETTFEGGAALLARLDGRLLGVRHHALGVGDPTANLGLATERLIGHIGLMQQA